MKPLKIIRKLFVDGQVGVTTTTSNGYIVPATKENSRNITGVYGIYKNGELVRDWVIHKTN